MCVHELKPVLLWCCISVLVLHGPISVVCLFPLSAVCCVLQLATAVFRRCSGPYLLCTVLYELTTDLRDKLVTELSKLNLV